MGNSYYDNVCWNLSEAWRFLRATFDRIMYEPEPPETMDDTYLENVVADPARRRAYQ